MHTLCNFFFISLGFLVPIHCMQSLNKKVTPTWKVDAKKLLSKLVIQRNDSAHSDKQPTCDIKAVKEAKSKRNIIKFMQEITFKNIADELSQLRKKYKENIRDINIWFAKKSLMGHEFHELTWIECDCIYSFFNACLTDQGLREINFQDIKFNDEKNTRIKISNLAKRLKYLSPLCIASLTDEQLKDWGKNWQQRFNLKNEQLHDLSNGQRNTLGLDQKESKIQTLLHIPGLEQRTASPNEEDREEEKSPMGEADTYLLKMTSYLKRS